MNEIEYAILPAVKSGVAKLATICRYLLVACVILALADPLIFFILYHPVAFLCRYASDLVMQLFLALLPLLTLWCHHVLLATRGTRITAMLALFCCILGAILLACLGYGIITGGELLLQHQNDAPLYITLLLLIGLCFNFHNMAGYPRSAKYMLFFFFFALLIVAITMGLLPHLCILGKIAACAIGYNLLLRLQHTAPLIISMPERD